MIYANIKIKSLITLKDIIDDIICEIFNVLIKNLGF